jgi:hypothetical protein
MLLQFTPANPDSIVAAVEQRLLNDIPVAGAPAVDGVIRLRATATPDTLQIDLIAHSKSGVLQLGDWDLADEAVAETLAKAWQPLQASLALVRVRLLGCNTARKRGWSTLGMLYQAFASEFGPPAVKVQGTTVPIGLTDFDAQGFTATSFLKSYVPLPPPPPTVPVQTPGTFTAEQQYDSWFDRFVAGAPISRNQVVAGLHLDAQADALRDRQLTPARLRWPALMLTNTSLDRVLDTTTSIGAFAPGLLAIPDYELLVRNGPLDTNARVSVFFDGAFLRVSSGNVRNATLFRVKRRGALATLFEQGVPI